MKDLRLELKLRNNLILRKIEEAGFRTLGTFCRAHDGQNYSELCEIVSMKKSALCRANTRGNVTILRWRTSVVRLAEKLFCDPEDLFSQATINELEKNRFEIEVDAADASHLLEAHRRRALPPDSVLEAKELKEELARQLDTLLPQEREVLKMRFGIYGEEKTTFGEIGRKFGRSTERIRQIESKALRKMRHPNRADQLRPLMK